MAIQNVQWRTPIDSFAVCVVKSIIKRTCGRITVQILIRRPDR